MRGAERPAGDQCLPRLQQSDNAMYFRGFEGFLEREWRQDCRQAFSQHGFAGARRSYKEHVMATSGSYFEGALYGLLAFDVREVHLVVVVLGENRRYIHLAGTN